MLSVLQTSTFSGSKPGEINPNFVKWHNLYKGVEALKGALPHVANLCAAVSMLDVAVLPFALKHAPVLHDIVWTEPTFVFNSARPMVDVKNAGQILFARGVKNSVELGGDHNRILLITGPNGSGKTTFLVTIGQLIILAQSIGLVPADSMRLTPFAFIGSSKDVHDDMQARKSLFAAEVRMIQELQKKIRSLHPGLLAFLVVDEPYSGTTEENGALFTTSLIKETARSYPNTILGLTSHHYLQFATLPKTTLGHMQVVHRGGINFDLAFKYLPGIAQWWYSGPLALRQAFAEYFKLKQLESVIDAEVVATMKKDYEEEASAGDGAISIDTESQILAKMLVRLKRRY